MQMGDAGPQIPQFFKKSIKNFTEQGYPPLPDCRVLYSPSRVKQSATRPEFVCYLFCHPL